MASVAIKCHIIKQPTTLAIGQRELKSLRHELKITVRPSTGCELIITQSQQVAMPLKMGEPHFSRK